MPVSFSRILETQSALCRAVRIALQEANDAVGEMNVRLSEWPLERPGCLFAMSVTLESVRTGQELGECRFTINAKGETFFDADDAPLAPCPPTSEACEAAIAGFVSRRVVIDPPLALRSAVAA